MLVPNFSLASFRIFGFIFGCRSERTASYLAVISIGLSIVAGACRDTGQPGSGKADEVQKDVALGQRTTPIPDRNAWDADDRLALAVQGNNLPDICKALDNGARVNGRTDPQLNRAQRVQPLARASSPDVAELLINRGADVNAEDEDGTTPLHGACIRNNVPLAKKLLERGADVKAKTLSLGDTPLHWCRSLAMAELMVGHGASVEAENTMGDTPMDSAAQQSEADCVKYYLQHGGNIRNQNAFGRTPLHNAVRIVGDIAVVKILLNAGAELEARDHDGRTPLALSAGLYHVDCLELLAGHGGKINTRDRLGMTPLHLAAKQPNIESATCLVKLGADRSAKDNAGMIPLAARG